MQPALGMAKALWAGMLLSLNPCAGYYGWDIPSDTSPSAPAEQAPETAPLDTEAVPSEPDSLPEGEAPPQQAGVPAQEGPGGALPGTGTGVLPEGEAPPPAPPPAEPEPPPPPPDLRERLGVGERTGTPGFGTGGGIGERTGTQGFGTGAGIGDRTGIPFGTGAGIGERTGTQGFGTGGGLDAPAQEAEED